LETLQSSELDCYNLGMPRIAMPHASYFSQRGGRSLQSALKMQTTERIISLPTYAMLNDVGLNLTGTHLLVSTSRTLENYWTSNILHQTLTKC